MLWTRSSRWKKSPLNLYSNGSTLNPPVAAAGAAVGSVAARAGRTAVAAPAEAVAVPAAGAA